MKRFILSYFVLLVLTSCQQDSIDSLKQRIDNKHLTQISGVINHLDPHLATGLAANLILGKTHESLYEIDHYSDNKELKPLLASSMPVVSEDGLQYLIKIKKGVLYHGLTIKRELIAEDFLNAFKRIGDSKLISPHYSYFSKQLEGLKEFYEKSQSSEQTNYSNEIRGIKIIDDYTIQFNLIAPNIDFPYLLTGPNTSPIPISAIKEYNNDFSSTLIGTGAFKLVKYIKNHQLEFVKNEKYHIANTPKLNRITTLVSKEAQTSWLNFLSGRVDYLEVQKDNFDEAFTDNLTLTKKLEKKGIRAGVERGKTNLYYFSFNNRLGILKNAELRKAIATGFDFKTYNKIFFNNNATIAKSFIPAGIEGNESGLNCAHHKNDKGRAKNLIKEIIKKNKINLTKPLTILVMNKTKSRQAGEFLKRELEEMGLSAVVHTRSWSALLKEVNEGRFDIFYMAWFTGMPRALEFFDLIYGGNYPGSFNRAGYQSVEFDSLFNKAKTALSRVEQNRYIMKMNKLACEDYPIMPLVHKKNMFLYYSYLKNYIPSDQIGGLEKYFDMQRKD